MQKRDADKAARSELLLILGGLAAIGSLSIAIYLPGLPDLARAFHASPAEAQTTVAAFTFGLCLGQLVYGPMSDRWGRRGPLLVGLGIYCFATIACLLVKDIGALAIARFVQGLGGCAGVVVSRAIVRDRFSLQDSASVYSTLMLIIGVSPILSPLAGGFLIAAYGWQSVFWVLLTFGVLLILAVFLRLMETSSPQSRLLAKGERALAGYRAVLMNRAVLAPLLCGGFGATGTFIYMTFSPHLLIEGFGVSTAAFGWVYGAGSLSVLIGSQVNRLLLKQHPHERLLRWSTGLNLLASCLMCLTVLMWPLSLLAFAAPLCLAFSMNGLSNPNASAQAMGAGGWRAGSVAAMLGCVQFGMGALGAVIAGHLVEATPLNVALLLVGCSLCAVLSLYIKPASNHVPPAQGLAVTREAMPVA